MFFSDKVKLRVTATSVQNKNRNKNLTIKLISDLNAKHDIEKLCNK